MKSARAVLTHPATGILSFRSPGNYFPGFVPLIVIYMHTVCAAATLFVTEEPSSNGAGLLLVRADDADLLPIAAYPGGV